MKRIYKYLVFFTLLFFIITGCSDFLDTKIDTFNTEDRMETNRNTMSSFANAFYAPMQLGFTVIDGNLFAAASDEAQQTNAISNVSYLTKGTVNANVNPLSYLFRNYYEGIRAAYFYLDYAKDGESFLALNRDTSSLADYVNKINYDRDIRQLNWYRAEAKVAMAYYYSELIKMYGGVPIIDKMVTDFTVGDIPRATYDQVVEHIVELIDSQIDNIQVDWATHPDNIGTSAGRFDKATALAIKTRALLYAASPRNNSGNDQDKWVRAAKAAHDLIVFKGYTMPENRDYRNSFVGTRLSDGDYAQECIYFMRRPASNTMETANYPISTPGGRSGVTPTHNLVSAYEYIGPVDPSDPYNNRDPRLLTTVVVNGSNWNDRTIDQAPEGADDMNKANTSTTGYYLKKFLTDNLNLIQGGTAFHLWPMYRYAEVLLNYAEAMNEAYGPDNIPGEFTISARQALMQVRNSASTSLPAITTVDRNEFRQALKHERRIELAFEDHRYWDLIRWKDAETVLNQPVKGVKVTKDMNGIFSYQVVNVAPRVFLDRNYYLPFTRADVENSKGTLLQNADY